MREIPNVELAGRVRLVELDELPDPMKTYDGDRILAVYESQGDTPIAVMPFRSLGHDCGREHNQPENWSAEDLLRQADQNGHKSNLPLRLALIEGYGEAVDRARRFFDQGGGLGCLNLWEEDDEECESPIHGPSLLCPLAHDALERFALEWQLETARAVAAIVDSLTRAKAWVEAGIDFGPGSEATVWEGHIHSHRFSGDYETLRGTVETRIISSQQGSAGGLLHCTKIVPNEGAIVFVWNEENARIDFGVIDKEAFEAVEKKEG